MKGDFDQGSHGADDKKYIDHQFYFEVRAERTCSGTVVRGKKNKGVKDDFQVSDLSSRCWNAINRSRKDWRRMLGIGN